MVYQLKGSVVALVTPFDESGRIDYQSIHDLIEWHIQEGTDAIVVCGTTGEAPCLTQEEHLEMIKQAVNYAARRIPIIAGTGSYHTCHSVFLTEQAQKLGADGALVIVPYYNHPTPEGCFLHFEKIGKVGLPMMVYHHPGRTGIKLPVHWLTKISDLPSVASIKEASGDMNFVIELLHTSKKPVFSGDDGLVIPILASGGIGAVSIVANIIPGIWKTLVDHLMQGHIADAQLLFKKIYPLVQAMVLETNPQCIKYAMSVMSKCRSEMRLPLIEPQEDSKKCIQLSLQLLLSPKI